MCRSRRNLMPLLRPRGNCVLRKIHRSTPAPVHASAATHRRLAGFLPPNAPSCLKAFVSSFASTSADTVTTPRLPGKSAERVLTLVAGPPPGGRASNNNNNNKNNKNKNENPFTDHPVIPDRVGFSAIQKRIDSIEGENKGADDHKRIDQGKGIRWVTARESGRRATTAPRAFPASSKALYTLPCAVWILLFNQGPQPSAGSSSSLPERALYCLWSHGLNSAVAFVERDGALRYALELKTRGLVTPGPTRVAMTDLQHFCHDRGFGIWMVPADVIPEAPQKVKTDQGFDPHRAAEAEQSRGGAGGQWGRAGRFPQRDQASPLGFGSGKREKEESLLTPEDVRKYRADFERLFAQE